MPLEEPNMIDMILRPDADGKVPLVITDAGVTRSGARRYELLMQKLRLYLHAVRSGQLKKSLPKSFPKAKTSDFYVQVVSTKPPTSEMQAVSQIRSRSQPEHCMEVRYVQFNGRPWPGARINLPDLPDQAPPPSNALRKFVEAELAFGFETIRGQCFMPFSAWLKKGKKEVAVLALPGDEAIRCARDMAAKLPSTAKHLVVIYDGFIGQANEKHDALLARASERGRARGLLFALKYAPAKGRSKARQIGDVFILGECENDLGSRKKR